MLVAQTDLFMYVMAIKKMTKMNQSNEMKENKNCLLKFHIRFCYVLLLYIKFTWHDDGLTCTSYIHHENYNASIFNFHCNLQNYTLGLHYILYGM